MMDVLGQAPLYALLAGLMVYLTAATGHLLFLAAAYFVVPERRPPAPGAPSGRFAILVPAHDEELLIARLCESLRGIRYTLGLADVFVIADNCTDDTARICSAFPVHVLVRTDPGRPGKGHAIDWALGMIPLKDYDAVLIVDADNVVHPDILRELNVHLARGEQAVQCHNAVGNRDDSWFTQLLSVSRTIGNCLYHHAKYKLGLSSYLMGNGICFSSGLLERKGWKAFSVGEDWEFYAQLVEERIGIGFAVEAKVFHQESRSLRQATPQRLRWSSGRFQVLRKYGIKLFAKGIRTRDPFTLDASLPLIFPNYSLLVNLTALYLALVLLFAGPQARWVLGTAGVLLAGGQAALFAAGVHLSKSYGKVLKALLYAPFFLLWKAGIDFLSFTGIYRGDTWVRTARHVSSDMTGAGKSAPSPCASRGKSDA